MTAKVLKLSEPAKFDLGPVLVTPALMQHLDPDYAFAALSRHLIGDWGLVDIQGWAANEMALTCGGRLLSVYPLQDSGGVFWIITEAEDGNGERYATTLLLPKDY